MKSGVESWSGTDQWQYETKHEMCLIKKYIKIIVTGNGDHFWLHFTALAFCVCWLNVNQLILGRLTKFVLFCKTLFN